MFSAGINGWFCVFYWFESFDCVKLIKHDTARILNWCMNFCIGNTERKRSTVNKDLKSWVNFSVKR